MKTRILLILASLFVIACSDKDNVKIPYVTDPVDMAFVCMENGLPVPYKDCNQDGRTLYGFILGGNLSEMGVANLLNGDYRDFNPSMPSYNPMYLDVPAGSLKRILSTDDSKYVFLLDYTEALLLRVDTVAFNVEKQDLPCRALDMAINGKTLFMTCPAQDQVLKMSVDDFGKSKSIESFDVKQPYKISTCKDRLFITHTRSYAVTFMDTNGMNARSTGLFAQCSDGIDNDGDGLIDNKDPGCAGPNDNDESDDSAVDANSNKALVNPAECSNGIDDDNDGLTDMDDTSCYNPLGISESQDPLHRVNALIPGPDCENVYALVTDPAMIMMLDATTGRVININKDKNSALMNKLGLRGAILRANPETGTVVKLTENVTDKGTFLWVSLANGRLVKFQIADDKGPKNVLTDSGIGLRDSASEPSLLVGDKLVDGGFAENVDYPSMGPVEIDLIPNTDNEYSFYGLKFMSPTLAIPDEDWTVTYEGRIPDTASVSGFLAADNTLSDPARDFCNLGVEKGDRVIFTGTPDECPLQDNAVKITDVMPHSLTLDIKGGISDICTKKGASYYIRATGQWIVNGSVTGFLHPWYSDGNKCGMKKDAVGSQGRVLQSMPKAAGFKLDTCPVYPGDPEIDWKPFTNMEFTFSIFPGCTIDKDYNITAVQPQTDTQIRFTAFNYLMPVSGSAGGHVKIAKSMDGLRVLYLVNRGADTIQEVAADTGEIEKTFY